MESNRFDAMTKLLSLGTTRRFLPGLGGLALLATASLDAEGKKKKKKKKKRCKTTNQNCTSGAECCAGLICAVGSFEGECESVDGDVCCLTAGKACSNLCDCCGSASICGDDNRCCVVGGGLCAQHSDCCGDNFCVEKFGEKTCRPDNLGTTCDNNDDCLGNAICINEICDCLGYAELCTSDRECCLPSSEGYGCNRNGRCGCVAFAGNCDVDGDCCAGTKCISGVCHCGIQGEACTVDADCCTGVGLRCNNNLCGPA